MDSCGCLCIILLQIEPIKLAALFIFNYPVRLVTKVHRPEIVALAVSLNERNYIVIYKHICLVAVLNERSPSLIILVLILEVIKGLNCCHYIDLILLCKIEQIVKILPMSCCCTVKGTVC